MTGNYILSFIGFMPADDPQILVYVAIDNPKGVVQYGGTVAAPIVRNVLLSATDILNIEPRKEYMSKKYNWDDIKYVKLPNVVGIDIKEARKMLKGFKIETRGEGNKVLLMSPSAETSIKEGSTIWLYLN